MTIPIEPGPFSFLSGAGQALGRYAEEREKKRQTQLKEATDRLSQMVNLRAAGLIPPESFSSPEATRLYEIIGIAPVSDKPTSAETIEQGKRDYLGQIAPSMSGGQPSDEARQMFGLPERGLTQKIEAGIAQNTAAVPIAQAAVPQAQLAGAQATAQLPEAAPTAIAGQQSTQDKTFNEIADRVVATVYRRSGKLPTVEQAFSAGLGDTRAQAFGERINAQYYGAAIDRLRAQLEDEKTRRLNAASRATGAAGTGLDDLYRIHQGQQTRITAELNALEKPSDRDITMADLAATQRAKGKPVSPLFANAEARVAEYRRRRGELEQQMQQSRDQLDRMLGQSTGAPGSTPPGTTGAPNKRAAAQEYEARVKGITDPARRKAIADEIARKYNIAPQTQRSSGAGGSF